MLWYETEGPERDVFVSTRVRLARNLVDYPFEPRLSEAGAKEIIEKAKSALGEDQGYTCRDLSAAGDNEKLALVEKHLISPEFARKNTPCALIENEEKQVYVMVCEEDHLRIQCIRPGFDPKEAMDAALEADAAIDAHLHIAFDEKLGYLTHCPTNLGTGLRISVMMFLPALTMTGRIKSIQGQLSKIGLTVRGTTGEGSAAKGCLYQFSNCVTQGVTEEEILSNLREAAGSIARAERETRKQLLENNEDALRDRVMRAMGTMRSAYMIDTEELYRLYADVRLGIALGICEGVSYTQLDALLIRCMPATLTSQFGKDLSSTQRDKARAEILRTSMRQAAQEAINSEKKGRIV